ncbi:MAG TPA: ribosomal protein S18-alanine N-acetyltransferase [Blastocatellia bacterium]
MSLSDSKIQEQPVTFKPYSIEQMAEKDLIEVVEMEESTGLNRWGYDAYRRELYKNPNSIMLVARNQYAGPCVLGFFAGWIIEDELHVNNIASHLDYRKMGIGQNLMEAAIDEGRMRGVSFVLLEVRASNDPAQSLYRKLGFSFIGRRRDYYRSPTEDAFVMKMVCR